MRFKTLLFLAAFASVSDAAIVGLVDDQTGQGVDPDARYPLSAGKSGGQTLTGGTGVNDALTLKGTSANGTSTDVSFKVNVGNNGATNGLTILNSGRVGIGGQTAPTQSLDVKGNITARNSTTPTSIFANSSYTDASNYKAAGIDTVTTPGTAIIGWKGAGTGAGLGPVKFTGTTFDFTGKLLQNSTQVLYLPNQTSFLGSFVAGNGGTNLVHGSGTEGYYNTLVGILAGTGTTVQSFVSALGYSAAQSNTGSYVTANGAFAGQNNSGDRLAAIGPYAARNNSGAYVLANGGFASQDNTGDYVVSNGYVAAQVNTGDYVTANGAVSARYNSGSHVTANGYSSAENNTGIRLAANGAYAAQNNTGANATASGAYAAANNTADNVTVNGYYSGYNSTGLNLTASGVSSGYNNSGSSVVANGYFAAEHNSGNNVTASGAFSAFANTGGNLTAIGAYAAGYNIGDQVTAIGQNSYNTWTNGTGYFISAANPSTEYLTVTSHGLGAAGVRAPLIVSSSTIGGLVNGSVYSFQVIDGNTLKALTVDITSTGTATVNKNANNFSNVTALGYDAEPNKNNQVILGDVNVVEMKTFGKIVTASNSIQISTDRTPASSSDTCVKGEQFSDATYLYKCTATNTIKRLAWSTF